MPLLGITRGHRMKLKYTLEFINMGDEIVAVPVGNEANQVHGVLKLNEEGQVILDLLKEDTNVDRIVDTIASTYHKEKALLTTYVENVVNKLRDLELIEE